VIRAVLRRARHQKGVLTMQLVDVIGQPRERGRRVGARYAEVIRELTNDNRSSLQLLSERRTRRPLEQREMRTRALESMRLIGAWAPELLEEAHGIAEGARIELEEVIALNDFLDCFDCTFPQLRAMIPGCTTFAASGPSTTDGGTYLGQNYDLRALYKRGAVLFRTRSSDGLEALVFSLAGMVGCAGLNAAGLGIVINNLTPGDSRPGVPYPFVLRRALESTRVADAMNVIASAKRASGLHYLIADASGEIIGLETTARDFEVLYALDGTLGHTNHYVHPALLSYDAPSKNFNGDSYTRWSRINRLLRWNMGRLDVARFMEFARDHAGTPQSICRHVVPDRSPLESGGTVASLVMDLPRRSLNIAVGNPCDASYTEHQLDAACDATVFVGPDRQNSVLA
jgi:isopenicillin-N N-acyltransferase like protein